MTLNVHRRRDRPRCFRVRVFLDGVDVTTRCFYADGRRGIVRLYSWTADGRPFLNDKGRPATEERRGQVRWQRLGHERRSYPNP